MEYIFEWEMTGSIISVSSSSLSSKTKKCGRESIVSNREKEKEKETACTYHWHHLQQLFYQFYILSITPFLVWTTFLVDVIL
jgi:hypothetical protein